MPPLDFPASPTVGQIYPVPAITGVPTYEWDGSKWLAHFPLGDEVVLVTGGVMTGPLTVPAPTLGGHATNKTYVDAQDTTLSTAITNNASAITALWGNHILSVSQVMDYGSIAAGSSVEATVTVTGAATTDLAIVNFPTAMNTGLIWQATVSAANTVSIRVANTTASAIDPTAKTVLVMVLKP
jgi:hypothetical protein